MDQSGDLVSRKAESLVTEALADTRVVTLNGAEYPGTTLNRYLELLSAVFLIKQIPAWSAGQTQRAIGTPKLAFVDPGIAAHLLGQDATRLAQRLGSGSRIRPLQDHRLDQPGGR